MATRNFHWSSVFGCVMSETDGADATQATYTHEPKEFGPLLSENRSGTESYHHYDALGSTTALTNDAGTVTDTFQYDAWGNSIARTGTTATRYQWSGRWGYQSDISTGGHYVRARTYQPSIARWTSVDPKRFEDSLNPYLALQNAPLLLADPSGAAQLDTRTMSNSGIAKSKFNLFITGTRPRLLDPACNDPHVEANFDFGYSIFLWPCGTDNAYFVQRVMVKCTAAPCGERAREQQYIYFEVFPVKRWGDVTDTAKFNSSGYGQYDQKGTVRFFCAHPGPNDAASEFDLTEDEEAALNKWKPNTYGTDHCKTSSGFAPSVDGNAGDPSFWSRYDKKSWYSEKERSLKMTWDCCCENLANGKAEPQLDVRA